MKIDGSKQEAEEQAVLASFSSAPLGPDDAELDRRDQEMDSGSVVPLGHEEFVAAVGRR